MTAILSSSVSCRTLVDGSLRLQVDIEPKDAQAAFALFGKPGAPVALALISNEAAVEHDRKAQAQPPAEPLERKPLSLVSKVAIACGDESMFRFLRELDSVRWCRLRKDFDSVGAEKGIAEQRREMASQFVREWCGVTTRSDITPGSKAGDKWLQLEASYHDWQRRAA